MSGSVWIATYVALWIAVVVLSFAVVALLRQIGVMHARMAPLGVHMAGEGPELDTNAPPITGTQWRDQDLTVVAFTAPDCEICHVLLPSLHALERQYADVGLVQIEMDDRTRTTFNAYNVQSTPYVVAVDAAGVVRGRGIANSLEQVEEMLEIARKAKTKDLS